MHPCQEVMPAVPLDKLTQISPALLCTASLADTTLDSPRFPSTKHIRENTRETGRGSATSCCSETGNTGDSSNAGIYYFICVPVCPESA
jgi:hypothetical protein